MIVTARKEWADKSRYLTTQAKDDPIEYVHNEIGYNYRLTNIQAAMGVAQMEKLDAYVELKRSIAGRYQARLEDVQGIILPEESSWERSTFWLYTIFVDRVIYGLDSRELMVKLKKSGIEARPLWHPLHTLRPFEQCHRFRIEVADTLYRDALSIPSSVGLTEGDQGRVIEQLRHGI